MLGGAKLVVATLAYGVLARLYFEAGIFRALESGTSYETGVVCFGVLNLLAAVLWPRPVLLMFPLLLPVAVPTVDSEALRYLLWFFVPAAFAGIGAGLLVRHVPRWWEALSD